MQPQKSLPMCTIPFARWISNAAVRFSGIRGAVYIQARRGDCSRQAIYDQARKVHGAVQAEYSGGPTREQLIQENQALREENTQLWNWLSLTIVFPLVKQHEFSAVALAMGLSLTQIAVLLALLLGAGGPGSIHGPSLGPGRRRRGRQGPHTAGRPMQGPGV